MNVCVVGGAGEMAEAAIPPEVCFAELNTRGIHVEATRRVVY